MADLPESFMVEVSGWFEVPSKDDIIFYEMKTIAPNDPEFDGYKTSRPYSDFEELRELLVSRHGDVQVPDIPPSVAPQDESTDDTIEIRMTGFQQFLNQVLAIIELKNDRFLVFFLLSNLSIDRIKEEIELEAQEDPNSNRQNEERTSQNNPDEDTSASDPDEHMDNRSDDGLIFQMDDVD